MIRVSSPAGSTSPEKPQADRARCVPPNQGTRKNNCTTYREDTLNLWLLLPTTVALLQRIAIKTESSQGATDTVLTLGHAT